MLKIEEIVFALFLVVAGAAGCALNNSTTFFLAMTVFFAAVIYLAKDLSKNVFILAFMVSFFTFLLGGETIMLLGLQENRYTFTAEADNHAYVAILISLVFLLLSYVAVNFLLPDRYGTTKSPESLPSNTPSIRRASLIFFYGTLVFKLIVNLSMVMYARAHGYFDVYTDYEFQGPGVFVKLATMSTAAFYIFLGTFPSKKECRLPVLIYLFATMLTIISGRRNDTITALLILFVYYCFRNIMYNNREVWVPKKLVYALVLASPLLLSVLYSITALRSGRANGLMVSYFSGMLNFFYQQGFSINVIKWAKQLEDSIPDKLYSLSQLYDFFTTRNFISRLLFNFKIYSGQTAERAMEGHRMSYLLTYLVFPDSYLEGYGVGSSYIAEAYHDFGYAGVAAVNCLYGYLLAKFNYINYRNPFLIAISFLMMQGLIMAPRSYADAFIGNILDFSNIEIFLAIWLVAKFLDLSEEQ